MSEETSPVFFVRFSDNRRRYIELQNKKFIQRKNNFAEYYTFNFIPIAITSSLLAPLNRLKLLKQIADFIPNKDLGLEKGEPRDKAFKYQSLISKIIKENKIQGLWRGNQFLNFKIFMQTSMKYFFFDRFKHKRDQANKYYKSYYLIQFFNNLFTSFASSFTALVFTYPFDLAYSRKAGKLSTADGNYNTFRNCFHTKIDTMLYYDIPVNKMLEMQKKKGGFLISKYFEGFSCALVLSTVALSLNMVGFSLIRDKVANGKENGKSAASGFFSVLGYTSALSLITSPVLYPFDTLLRQVQVNGGRGYNNKFDSGIDYFKSLISGRNTKGMYSGYSLYLARNIPFSYIQYNIYILMTSIFLSKDDKEMKNSENRDPANKIQ